jgi:hypothetical protein
LTYAFVKGSMQSKIVQDFGGSHSEIEGPCILFPAKVKPPIAWMHKLISHELNTSSVNFPS